MLVAPCNSHHVLLVLFVPYHLRVAKLGQTATDHGVAGVLLVGHALVGTDSKRYLLTTCGGRIERQYAVLSEARHVAFVHDTAAGENTAHLVGIEYRLVFFPTQEVRRRSVPPRHTPEINVLSIGVELVIEMPPCAIEYHTVRVVHPVVVYGVMYLRAIEFLPRTERLGDGIVLCGSVVSRRRSIRLLDYGLTRYA